MSNFKSIVRIFIFLLIASVRGFEMIAMQQFSQMAAPLETTAGPFTFPDSAGEFSSDEADELKAAQERRQAYQKKKNVDQAILKSETARYSVEDTNSEELLDEELDSGGKRLVMGTVLATGAVLLSTTLAPYLKGKLQSTTHEADCPSPEVKNATMRSSSDDQLKVLHEKNDALSEQLLHLRTQVPDNDALEAEVRENDRRIAELRKSLSHNMQRCEYERNLVEQLIVTLLSEGEAHDKRIRELELLLR